MATESPSCQQSTHGKQGAVVHPSRQMQIAHALEMVAMFVLLMVVGMRPLLSETYNSGLYAIEQAANAPETVTTATTAFFDLAIWLAALAAIVAAGLQRIRWRWSGVEAGWIILLVAAVVSTITTSNQRLAINASCDWLSAIVILVVLAHLCRNRLRIALVLSVIVASGVASAAKCGMQVGVEYAETREMYEQNKQTFWQRQGVAMDDPQVELFERRMDAREATGFFPHSNAQGAWLSLAGFAALAAGGLRQHRRWRQVLFAGVAFILLSSILLTGSAGAAFAALVGLCLWRLGRYFNDQLRQHWRKLLIVAWLAVVLGAVGLAAYGRVRGGLPGASLNFRWQYWQVTGQVIQDHFWTGVGALNFDRAYLLHKPITQPEEIKDPHNFVLAIVSQWGILGGAGLLLVFVGASFVKARAWGQRNSSAQINPVEARNANVQTKIWLVALLAGYIVLRMWLLRGLWHYQAGGAALWFDLGFYGFIWGIAAVVTLWGTRQETTNDPYWYRIPVCAGVAAFLLHNAIDSSLFFPGTLTPFMAMGGLVLAGPREPVPENVPMARRFALAVVVMAALVGLLVFFVVPVARSSHLLSTARHQDASSAVTTYQAAAKADPLDPTPLVELAALQANVGELAPLDQAIRALDEAIQRDPDQLTLYQRRAALLEHRYHLTGAQVDLMGAIGAARRCVLMYPTSPDGHLDLADLIGRTATELDAPALVDEAIEHYRQAIALNDTRPGTDEVRRWSAEYRKQVLGRMHALQSLATTTNTPG